MTAPEWPADKVERWPLERLIPYAMNARTHTPEQIRQIAVSMREWGWTIPVLADEQGTIIAGHARVSAAEINGYGEAPVMVARGWTEAKKRAYVLADNKLHLNLRFQASFTNVFNHTNFGNPNLNISFPASAGVITSVNTQDFAGPRQGQVGLRLDF